MAKAIEEGEPLHIDDIVLCELVWVLRGGYRREKAVIVTALQKIASTALFTFNDRDVLRQAVADYRGGSGDFADYPAGEQVGGHATEVDD